MDNKEEILKEELLDCFIAENIEYFKTAKYNIFCIIFPEYYMFYRKMFIYGILTITIKIIVFNILPIKTNYALTIISLINLLIY